jgi:anti-sigma regulatory factor (Ser/Thr protein kinase)
MLEVKERVSVFFAVRGAAWRPGATDLTGSPDLTSVLRSARRQAHEQGGQEMNTATGKTATREHSVSCQLSREPAQVRQAREQARQALCGWGLGQHAELAGLIVSELATNAIQHGAGPVQVRVSYARGDLRVDVHDDGAGRPARRPLTAGDESGRGLALLDDLTGQRGGTRAVANDRAGPGKTVSVTVRLAAGGRPVTGAPARTARRIRPGTRPRTGGRPRAGTSCPGRRPVTCQHAPPCPPAHAPDRAAARIITGHPEQGWNLLCNAIVLFDDTGMLLPDGTAIEPHRTAGRTPADDLLPNRARPRGSPRAARACP